MRPQYAPSEDERQRRQVIGTLETQRKREKEKLLHSYPYAALVPIRNWEVTDAAGRETSRDSCRAEVHLL